MSDAPLILCSGTTAETVVTPEGKVVRTLPKTKKNPRNGEPSAANTLPFRYTLDVTNFGLGMSLHFDRNFFGFPGRGGRLPLLVAPQNQLLVPATVSSWVAFIGVGGVGVAVLAHSCINSGAP